MATGVLIMGVGKGTKQLQGFLECTKTYEATVLFGAATDTYDVLGKVLKKAEYAHVTRESVEKALEQFRGKIMQRPPLYSALRMEGKRLYEYAREGKEVPKEIEKRPVEVKELAIVEWLEGGSHEYKWPKEEAEEEAKDLAEKVHRVAAVSENETVYPAVNRGKRKRSIDGDDDDGPVSSKKPNVEEEEKPETLMSGGLQSPERQPSEQPEPTLPSTGTDQDQAAPIQQPSTSAQGPPAIKLRMTVTSGFYVRSLSHDLGEAVGSLACMSELVRTRQGGFTLGKNVLEYDVLEKGEEVWGPQVERLVNEWGERGEDKGGGEKH